jgi:hypothetical protein
MRKLEMKQMENLQGGILPSFPKVSDYSCAEGYLAIAASLGGAVVPYNALKKGYSCVGSWFD